ncbi:MAG: tetratricopeptide repeat protein [Gammaproteobacteria bacterium]|jgi:TPR repeat protein
MDLLVSNLKKIPSLCGFGTNSDLNAGDVTEECAINFTMYIRLILAIFFTAAGINTACAGFDEGIRAYKAKNFPKALREFREADKQNHAGAQYYLGRMYLMWEGVRADYKQSVNFFRRSAAQGNVNAQFYLGTLYYLGEGVSQDYAKAAEWYTKAATQGDPVAQYYLGVMYASGEGVSRNHIQSLVWLALAERGGSETAGKFRGIIASKMTTAELFKAKQLTLKRLSIPRKRKSDQ